MPRVVQLCLKCLQLPKVIKGRCGTRTDQADRREVKAERERKGGKEDPWNDERMEERGMSGKIEVTGKARKEKEGRKERRKNGRKEERRKN